MSRDPVAAVLAARQDALAGMRPDPARLPARAGVLVRAADEVGAPLVPALDAAAEAVRADRELARAVAAAAAPGRLVATALVALPFALVPLLGRLTGTDPWAFYAAGIGRLVALAGLTLWLVGAVAIARLVRAVTRAHVPARGGGGLVRWLLPVLGGVLLGPVGVVVGLVAAVRRRPPAPAVAGVAVASEVAAAGLDAGLAGPAALRLASRHVTTLAAELRRVAWCLDLGVDAGASPVTALAEAMVRLRDHGGPAAAALRVLAREARADVHAAALARAQQLPVRLAVPTTLCLLPATLLLVGAPVVAAGLQAVTSP